MTEDLGRYLELSRSDDPDDRAEAARELRQFLRNDPGCEALTTLIGDSDWRVRRAAVESFLEMRAYNAIPGMLQALYTDDNAGKRNAAIDILSRFGKEILPFVEPHLNSDNTDVRMFLINILGDLRDDTFLPFITTSLDHPDANIVSSAILALGKIGHPESIPDLKRFLASDDLWLIFQAIEAAGEMQDVDLIPDLEKLHESQFYRKAVLKALSKLHHEEAYRAIAGFVVSDGLIDSDAIGALVDLYYSPGPAALKGQEQRAIRHEFRDFFPAAGIPTLLQTFQQSPDLTTRKTLLEVLGWLKSPEAYAVLIQSLRVEELSEIAAAGLIRADREAAAAVVKELENDTGDDDHAFLLFSVLNQMAKVPESTTIKKFLQHASPDIRYQAYKLAGRSSASETAPLLANGMLDPHQQVSEICRDILIARSRSSRTVRDEVLELMRPHVHSEVPEERANAIEFVTLMEGEATFPMLFQALKDEDAGVRRKAVALMGTGYHDQFQRPLIGALADEDAGVREVAARALGLYSSDEAIDALLSGMRDEALWVRMASYESLSQHNAERIADAFLAQIDGENPMARATLLKAVGKFRTPRVKEALLRHLNSEDPVIRKNACESLALINDNDVVFHLFTLLQNDHDWGVRVASIKALTTIKPFRLQEALLQRLKADTDPFVRREILQSLQKLSIEFLPEEVFEFLLDRNLADVTYEFLMSTRHKFLKQLQEAAKTQPPAIRRILKAIVN